jgi:N-methylhydantoinase A
MMTSAGGMTTLDTARHYAIRLVESGPSGGAIFASRVAEQCGLDHVVSFDMGGTTAKFCFIDDCKPITSRHFEIARTERFFKGSGIQVRIPAIEMIEIGAGGGSVATVDQLQRISIGPESMGSVPAPACFGIGGTTATVTDADVVLGYIDTQSFADGQLNVDCIAAQSAITSDVGDTLGLNVVRRERRGFSVGAIPTRQLSFQPVATGADVEVTKRLKPPGQRVVKRLGEHAGRNVSER